NCHKELLNGGKLILTFRDLTNELQGINRFIPVKSEEGRIFICFLEYSPEYIDVYDIVNELKDGIWVQKISSYKKIKISPDTIKKYLIDLKFEINYFEVNKGLITVIAKKNRT
ncbi:SAM-dependent methyltransferase, partial [Candidatus Desantisbacteria bacterium]|nr:SAM-dependent methyltransferase [Candidatus Desantisbacteria bacterium]